MRVEFVNGDLIQALKEMLNLQIETFGVDAVLEVIRHAPLNLEVHARDSLYRIAQEAVTNARRHGLAQSIRVILHIRPTSVRLEVLDDGIGMPTVITKTAGIGLKIMKYRSELMGACLSVEPGHQGGTLFSVECPQL